MRAVRFIIIIIAVSRGNSKRCFMAHIIEVSLFRKEERCVIGKETAERPRLHRAVWTFYSEAGREAAA